jgi:hypothetical protein
MAKGRIVGYKHSDETKIKISNSLTGRKQSQETIDKIKMAERQEKHWNWKKNPSYGTLHNWITRLNGKPKQCEHCGLIGEKEPGGQWNIDWANTNHKYKRKKEDFIGLCSKCHRIYDTSNKLI